MKRFKRFLGMTVAHSIVQDEDALASLGVESRWVPEELEEFDEMEFGLGQWADRTVIFTLVIEKGGLQRVSLGYIPPGGDEDDMVAFSEEELALVLDEKQATLIGFFEKVTAG